MSYIHLLALSRKKRGLTESIIIAPQREVALSLLDHQSQVSCFFIIANLLAIITHENGKQSRFATRLLSALKLAGGLMLANIRIETLDSRLKRR
jgi:hypothetical protein